MGHESFVILVLVAVEICCLVIAVAMSTPREPHKILKADRPFLYYIKVKGVIVFVGRVTTNEKFIMMYKERRVDGV